MTMNYTKLLIDFDQNISWFYSLDVVFARLFSKVCDLK